MHFGKLNYGVWFTKKLHCGLSKISEIKRQNETLEWNTGIEYCTGLINAKNLVTS